MPKAFINIHEAKTHLSKLVERVEAGEEILIARAGKPVVKLIPYEDKPIPRRQPGSMRGKIWISPDFDKEDKEMEALFYEGELEPPVRHTRTPVVARRQPSSVRAGAAGRRAK